MLHGLYVFGLIEDAAAPADALAYWAERGLQAAFTEDLGDARHVFTHRVWNMRILRFRLSKPPGEQFLAEHGALLADCAQLKALPLPTAMKAAKEAALRLLQQP